MSTALTVGHRHALAALPAPTRFERLLGLVAPQAAMRRYQARAAFGFLSSTGGYVGARTDRRATKEWYPGVAGVDSDQLPDVLPLRARSRDLVRNAGMATGAVNTTVRSTIGTGLRPHPQVDQELLGLTDEAADAWERKARRLWDVAADSTTLDVTDRLDFAQQCDLICRSEFESGDVFAVRRYLERPGQLFGLKLQLLEADRVCNPDHQPDRPDFAGGIEFDVYGAPRAYHVASRNPGDYGLPLTWTALPARGPRSGERQVLHVFRPLRPDQSRGMPMLAPVIEPLKQLERYTEAELMAAVVASLFTVFVKQEGMEDPTGLQGSTDGTALNPATSDLRLSAGAVIGLAQGESIEIADPKRPNDKFDPFFVAMCRQVAVATELPVEVILLQFTSSYSASRAAIQEAWRSFLTRRSRIVRQFCQPVYEWVIAEAVARGYLEAPGFFDSPLIRAAWLAADWRGPVPSSLSPVDDANAAQTYVTMGVKSLQEVTAETTGGEWERTHRQRAKEVRMRREAGLDVEPVAERVATEPRQPAPPNPPPVAVEPGRVPDQEAA